MSIRRVFYTVAGWASVALALAGVVLPVLPTTPFVLLAAACFTRSSPRAAAWLAAHPHLGPPLNAWRDHGAVSRRARWAAAIVMGTMLAISALAGMPAWVVSVQGLAMMGVTLFLFTRPLPPVSAGAREKT